MKREPGSWRSPFPFGKQEKQGRVETDPGPRADTYGVGGKFHAVPEAERRLLAVPVLKVAWALVKAGWCRDAPCNAAGELARWNEPAAYHTLRSAIYAAAARMDPEQALGYFAEQVIKGVLFEHNLVAWNDHPRRTKPQVLAVLRRGVTWGQPVHRGGWSFSSGVGR